MKLPLPESESQGRHTDKVLPRFNIPDKNIQSPSESRDRVTKSYEIFTQNWPKKLNI